ncbi:hypothetical protein BTO28_14090 [Domibacillus epiphyticus]|uniref:Uncharacterized protein n=1 Tax=Domibacillus epiphyticus TaxID=1714355 RepID=A0A1V2A542_9BACI|nr:hypothetical protein BTO28_14090 [Domibacillus epiphyticus]
MFSYFHGGGFFGGTIDVVENPCKSLAEKANGAVIPSWHRTSFFSLSCRLLYCRKMGASVWRIDW